MGSSLSSVSVSLLASSPSASTTNLRPSPTSSRHARMMGWRETASIREGLEGEEEDISSASSAVSHAASSSSESHRRGTEAEEGRVENVEDNEVVEADLRCEEVEQSSRTIVDAFDQVSRRSRRGVLCEDFGEEVVDRDEEDEEEDKENNGVRCIGSEISSSASGSLDSHELDNLRLRYPHTNSSPTISRSSQNVTLQTSQTLLERRLSQQGTSFSSTSSSSTSSSAAAQRGQNHRYRSNTQKMVLDPLVLSSVFGMAPSPNSNVNGTNSNSNRSQHSSRSHSRSLSRSISRSSSRSWHSADMHLSPRIPSQAQHQSDPQKSPLRSLEVDYVHHQQTRSHDAQQNIINANTLNSSSCDNHGGIAGVHRSRSTESDASMVFQWSRSFSRSMDMMDNGFPNDIFDGNGLCSGLKNGQQSLLLTSPGTSPSRANHHSQQVVSAANTPPPLEEKEDSVAEHQVLSKGETEDLAQLMQELLLMDEEEGSQVEDTEVSIDVAVEELVSSSQQRNLEGSPSPPKDSSTQGKTEKKKNLHEHQGRRQRCGRVSFLNQPLMEELAQEVNKKYHLTTSPSRSVGRSRSSAEGERMMIRGLDISDNKSVSGSMDGGIDIEDEENEDEEVDDKKPHKWSDGLNILVIDASAPARRQLARRLVSQAHAVVEAVEDGRHALEVYTRLVPMQGERVDLILLDCALFDNIDPYISITNSGRANATLTREEISSHRSVSTSLKLRKLGYNGPIFFAVASSTSSKAQQTLLEVSDADAVLMKPLNLISLCSTYNSFVYDFYGI